MSARLVSNALMAALASCAVSGCAALKSSVLPADFAQDSVCIASQILAGDVSAVSIEAACLPGQLTTVVDAIEFLLTTSFGAAHPTVVAPLTQDIAAQRALGTAGR